MAAGTGFDIGAAHRNGAELDLAHFAHLVRHLNKQFCEFAQVDGAKLSYRAVGGESRPDGLGTIVLHGARQELLLFGVVGDMACIHAQH